MWSFCKFFKFCSVRYGNESRSFRIRINFPDSDISFTIIVVQKVVPYVVKFIGAWTMKTCCLKFSKCLCMFHGILATWGALTKALYVWSLFSDSKTLLRRMTSRKKMVNATFIELNPGRTGPAPPQLWVYRAQLLLYDIRGKDFLLIVSHWCTDNREGIQRDISSQLPLPPQPQVSHQSWAMLIKWKG